MPSKIANYNILHLKIIDLSVKKMILWFSYIIQLYTLLNMYELNKQVSEFGTEGVYITLVRKSCHLLERNMP